MNNHNCYNCLEFKTRTVPKENVELLNLSTSSMNKILRGDKSSIFYCKKEILPLKYYIAISTDHRKQNRCKSFVSMD